MASTGRLKLIDAGQSKLRYQYAGVLAGIGAVLVFIAVKVETRQFLIPASVVRRTTEQGFTRIWFDDGDLPVGARQQGPRLNIRRWSGGSWQFDLTGGEERPAWTMPSDLSRLGWVSGGNLYCRTQPLEPSFARPVAIRLSGGKKPLALSTLSDGAIAVVFDDATVARWDCSDGRLLGENRLAFANPEQAAAEQDYVSLGSARAGIISFHYRPGEGWQIVERAPAPDLAFRLVIPGPGMTAALSDAGLHREGNTLNTPGAVRAAAAHLDDLIVTGDFDKAIVLPHDGERYVLTDAQPASLAAVSHNRVAISGQNDTRLITLGIETRLTATGRTVSRIGAIFLGLAAVLCFAPMLIVKLLDLISQLIRGGKKKLGGANIPRTLEKPPLELVQGFAAGEGVLWAGAGLSAQSGLPSRQGFIQGLLQTADVEGLAEGSALRKFRNLAARGDGEAALDELVASIPQRSDLIAHYRAVYYKYVAQSRSHELISRIPLSAVITTNYDGLLDCADGSWSSTVVTLRSKMPAAPDVPFLLKLYGDLPSPPTVVLSRREFHAAFPKSGVAHIPHFALTQRCLLFVGCSIEGLLADLNLMLGQRMAGHAAGSKPTRAHFAAVGVSGSGWTKIAAELNAKFGIRVLPCSEETIREALPAFLETLVEEIEKVQHVEHPGAAVLAGEQNRV